MINFNLNIGDVITRSEPAQYTCYGLGSCIGLFLQDRISGHSGGAHIFLPAADYTRFEYGKYYCVESALNEMLRQFQKMGNNLANLRAKVTGGANFLNSNFNTGQENATLILRELTERMIYLAASDIGGVHPRTVRFDSSSGKLEVTLTTINQTKIY